MFIKNKLLFGIVSMISFMAIFFIPAVAQAYPLEPGCYRVVRGVFTKVQCDTEGQSRSIIAPLNKCFVGSSTGGFTERNCTTGAIASQDSDSSGSNPPETVDGTTSEDAQKIYDRLAQAINILSGLIGIVAVVSIIIAGIQYTTSSGDPQKVAAAKSRIINSIFALLAFFFLYAFLQYLVPGGVL